MILVLCKLVKYLHIISKTLRWESMITLQDFKPGNSFGNVTNVDSQVDPMP